MSAASGGFLERMARSSRARAAELYRRIGLAELRSRAERRVPPPTLRPSADGFDVIAEIKLRSPSLGVLHDPGDGSQRATWVRRRASQYQAAGAAGISVLTEPDAFGGYLDDLSTAAEAVEVPVMRKDFVVDPIQVYEARAAGAGAVLLIVRILEARALRELATLVQRLSMVALVEAFDRADLVRAARLAGDMPDGEATLMLGLNARNLTTLEVDTYKLERLRDTFPAECMAIAESGVTNAADAARVAEQGYDAALVGTALMTSANPVRLLQEMLEAGRRKRRAAVERLGETRA